MICAQSRMYPTCQKRFGSAVWDWNERCSLGPASVFEFEAVIQGVDAGRIPRAQYGATMIDEGHDFEPEWLKLVTQMVGPSTDSLLLLYDDAQSIYRKSRGLGFSLSSPSGVGIKAAGRTSIVRLN